MSAPLPFVPDPRALQHVANLPLSRYDRDRIDQAWHDLNRLAAIEHAYAVGDPLDGLMAGVDPIETKESVAYLASLLSRLMVGEAVQSRVVPVEFRCDPDESGGAAG